MENKNKKIIAVLMAVGIPAAYLYIGTLFKSLTVRNYKLKTKKISKPFRIVLISDLHSFTFGENQCELTGLIKKQKPDLIMLAGDIFVEYKAHENPIILLKGIMDIAPCYYVMGNHEILCADTKEIKKIAGEHGIVILEGSCKEVEVNGQNINICGLDDPFVGEARLEEEIRHLTAVKKNNYSILLSHRAELVEEYKEMNFDLVLAGHSHGGQWRLPYILNGVYAPYQGIFPKYAGGLYEYNNTVEIVSRGLGLVKYERIPRIYNPPEVVVVDIEPNSDL